MALRPLTPDTRSQYGLASDVNGVLVGQVTPGTNADEGGVQAGDVIEQVNGHEVRSPSQVADAIHTAERQKREAISLLILRNGTSSYLGPQLQA
jgi:serine protease Do